MMVPKEGMHSMVEPADLITHVLEDAWIKICAHFGIDGGMPDLQDLFQGADLSDSRQASRTVLAAMLQEVIERVGRFNPWYRQPARSYGLTSVRDRNSFQGRWTLAPEAALEWQDVIESLSAMIYRYSGLIQALIMVADLIGDYPSEACIAAQCACFPPVTIQLKKSVLDQAEIFCQQCQQPFAEQ